MQNEHETSMVMTSMEAKPQNDMNQDTLRAKI